MAGVNVQTRSLNSKMSNRLFPLLFVFHGAAGLWKDETRRKKSSAWRKISSLIIPFDVEQPEMQGTVSYTQQSFSRK